jgi:hypothetical protein
VLDERVKAELNQLRLAPTPPILQRELQSLYDYEAVWHQELDEWMAVNGEEAYIPEIGDHLEWVRSLLQMDYHSYRVYKLIQDFIFNEPDVDK